MRATATMTAPAAATVPRHVLPVTVVALAGAAAAFFAGSAAAPVLVVDWGLSAGEGAALTWASQAGFIAGTLASALLNLPDRYAPSRVVAALLALAALANGAFAFLGPGQTDAALALRFAAGALGGPVYPIGMKLLATWYPRLGWELGVLLAFNTVGFGAAFVARAFGVPWQGAVLGASALAAAGAVAALALLREGPLLPARSPFDPMAAARAFREPSYRRSALAYFGHMWELFAFWALLPFWLAAAGFSPAGAAALAAGVFAAGAVGCVAAGAASRRAGEARAALVAVAASGGLCLASPWLFGAPRAVVVVGVLAWGAAVIADSAMYSALSARAAPRAYVGTALTTQNLLGFAVTIASIALLPAVAAWSGSWRWAFLALAPGPLLAIVPLVALARSR